MRDDPRGTVFRPRYRWFVQLAVAIPVLFGGFVAGSSLVLHGSFLGAAIALGMFAGPPLLLFGGMCWFRRLEFRDHGLRLERPLLPDKTVPYDEFSQLGGGGAKAGTQLLIWAMMSNGTALKERFKQLEELGLTRNLEFSEEALDQRNVRQTVIPICTAIVTGVVGGLIAGGMSVTSALIAAFVAAVVSYRVLMRTLNPDAVDEPQGS